jgi:hypothetical protein
MHLGNSFSNKSKKFYNFFKLCSVMSGRCIWLKTQLMGKFIANTRLFFLYRKDHVGKDWSGKSSHLPQFFFILCKCVTGIWTQGFTLAKQELYHLTHISSPIPFTLHVNLFFPLGMVFPCIFPFLLSFGTSAINLLYPKLTAGVNLAECFPLQSCIKVNNLFHLSITAKQTVQKHSLFFS